MRYLRLALGLLVLTGCATHVARRPAAVRRVDPASPSASTVAGRKPAAAQTAAVKPTTPVAQAPAAPSSPAWLKSSSGGAPRVVVVLGFRGPMEAWALAIMADEAQTAAAEAVQEHGFTVVGGATAQALIASPRRPLACAGAACEIEAARRSGAELVVMGEVTRQNEMRVGTLRLYETSTGAVVNSTRFGGGSPTELIEKTYWASASLFK